MEKAYDVPENMWVDFADFVVAVSQQFRTHTRNLGKLQNPIIDPDGYIPLNFNLGIGKPWPMA